MRWVSYIVVMGLGMVLAKLVVFYTTQAIEKNYQIILYSLSICDHCAVFETDIAKPYKSHKLAKRAPLKLVNMDDEGSGPHHLTKPITQAPTAVLFENGKEIARLEGLVAPFHFYLFVQKTLALKQPETAAAKLSLQAKSDKTLMEHNPAQGG